MQAFNYIYIVFFIQYISICVFPVIIFFTFLYLFLANYNLLNLVPTVIIVTTAIGMLGMIITYLIARSYQSPISIMKLAADRIRNGYYDISVPVVSSDELGNLGEALNEMSSRALTIKLSDRLSNVSGLINKDIPIDFVKWYVKETQYILNNLDRDLNTAQKYLVDKLKNMLNLIVVNRL